MKRGQQKKNLQYVQKLFVFLKNVYIGKLTSWGKVYFRCYTQKPEKCTEAIHSWILSRCQISSVCDVEWIPGVFFISFFLKCCNLLSQCTHSHSLCLPRRLLPQIVVSHISQSDFNNPLRRGMNLFYPAVQQCFVQVEKEWQ